MYIDRTLQFKQSFVRSLDALGFRALSDSSWRIDPSEPFELVRTRENTVADWFALMELLGAKPQDVRLPLPHTIKITWQYGNGRGITSEIGDFEKDTDTFCRLVQVFNFNPERVLSGVWEKECERDARVEEIENREGCVLVERLVRDANTIGFDLIPQEEDEAE